MKTFLILTLLSIAPLARGADPSDAAFEKAVDLSPLRTIAVQDQQTIKTLDTFARQRLDSITGRGTFDGHDPVYTLMDMAAFPHKYDGVNLIKVASLPVREDFQQLTSISADEQKRIIKTGLVSEQLLDQPEVQQLLQSIKQQDNRKGEAVNRVMNGLTLYSSLTDQRDPFVLVATVPPPPGTSDGTWRAMVEVSGYSPAMEQMAEQQGRPALPKAAGYSAALINPAIDDAVKLMKAWHAHDAAAVNSAAVQLAAALRAVNPQAYPSALKLNVEVIYNRLAKLTIPGSAFYFFALVCFLTGSTSGLGRLRLWGLRFAAVGFLIHTIGIGVRWWLVGSIPIKNEFESVMFSAWFGVAVGMMLELWRGRGMFGAGASFVGWMALTALFAAPYVFGADLGQEIRPAAGVLMSYWLYIHVTMVTASYALIGISFLLSIWWLVRYYADYARMKTIDGNRLGGDARGFDVVYPTSAAVVHPGIVPTLARMIFLPVPSAATAAESAPVRTKLLSAKATEAGSIHFLAALDACNLVVLQMAFWVLGTGIVLGAVWADESWGRPWAWDPKETFALVTWIVYLIIVHTRFATPNKAWWTSVLAVIGFFVMLFNWIGVNYYLPGLHSYAG
jgi:cytochrome c-type biogenesis protein CcsB